jgi:hypothetical protein
MLEIFSDVLGQQNVTGIAAIHHALRDIDSRAGDIRLFVQIGDRINWTAVDSHSHPKLRVFSQFPGDLKRTQYRRFRRSSKHQRCPVTCRESQQLAFGLGGAELLRATHDLFQRL